MHANGWTRGAYQCLCRPGYYSARHPNGFNGTYMEVAYQEYRENVSTYYMEDFRCVACAEGCVHCNSSAPCLASYNWIFRLSLLSISVLCAGFTLTLAGYMYRHRKVKVFKVASPIFLTITLLGCAIMYFEVRDTVRMRPFQNTIFNIPSRKHRVQRCTHSTAHVCINTLNPLCFCALFLSHVPTLSVSALVQMAAIFPILDVYSCIATKWTRHMGFCITYTALLMKTWR